jgi:hypothetical protein
MRDSPNQTLFQQLAWCFRLARRNPGKRCATSAAHHIRATSIFLNRTLTIGAIVGGTLNDHRSTFILRKCRDSCFFLYRLAGTALVPRNLAAEASGFSALITNDATVQKIVLGNEDVSRCLLKNVSEAKTLPTWTCPEEQWAHHMKPFKSFN